MATRPVRVQLVLRTVSDKVPDRVWDKELDRALDRAMGPSRGAPDRRGPAWEASEMTEPSATSALRLGPGPRAPAAAGVT